MAAILRLATLSMMCACALAQYGGDERAQRYIPSENKVTSTPVPILKQINRHNEDGSYTYGYEAADGSFKIETKSPTGEVKGKYGYKDDTGKVRTVEYGANKYGFQPSGEGITVAPPTLVDESTSEQEPQPGKSQSPRNQYRAQPAAQAVDYDYEEPSPRPAPRAPPQYRPHQQQQQQQQYRPQQQQYQPPQQHFRPQQSAPTPPKPAFFSGAAPAPVQQELFRPAPPAPHRQPRPPAPVDYAQDFESAPAQRFTAEPRFVPQPIPQPQRNQQFSMLDQLLKEFALPSNGAAPYHDVTFGTF